MDIRTIFAVLITVSTAEGLLMLLYRSRQKVHAGFSLWVAAYFVLAAGYLLVGLRGVIPLAISVLAGNLLLFTGAMLRLDGTARFLGLPRLRRSYYASLALPMAVYSWFVFVREVIAVRVFIGSIVLIAIALAMARLLILRAPAANRAVYFATAGMNIIFSIATLARALVWARHPGHRMLDPSLINTLFFFAVALCEICWGMVFMMMNNERVEEDLRGSERTLREKNAELTQALAQVRTLSGLLPICASCRKIRNDKGYWQKIEHYVMDHSDARFSHGICPECMRELYPEVANELSEDKD